MFIFGKKILLVEAVSYSVWSSGSFTILLQILLIDGLSLLAIPILAKFIPKGFVSWG